MPRIVITGVPGSGKTTLAKALAKKLRVEYIDLNAISMKHAVKKKVGKEFEINLKKLQRVVRKITREKENFVLEGHLACEIKIPCGLIVILRCNPLVLIKRLKKRRYSRKKIIDNALAEAQDYFVLKAEENYRGKYIELNATKRVSISRILTAVRGRKSEKITWARELLWLASQGL